jgi:hypothetical protein
MSRCKAREMLRNGAGLTSAAMTKDERNAADGRFATACLSCLFNLSRPDTPCTDVLSPDATVLDNPYLLDIRAPDSFRFPVGMAHAIPDDRPLSAHGTDP